MVAVFGRLERASSLVSVHKLIVENEGDDSPDSIQPEFDIGLSLPSKYNYFMTARISFLPIIKDVHGCLTRMLVKARLFEIFSYERIANTVT